MNNGWIGVDLDGVLAHYDHWRGINHIGEPIPKMVARVKQWLAEGKDVRILTARVAPALRNPSQQSQAFLFVIDWCRKHLGCVLPVTHEKDRFMVEMWDDRCVQVIPNSGDTIQERLQDLSVQLTNANLLILALREELRGGS